MNHNYKQNFAFVKQKPKTRTKTEPWFLLNRNKSRKPHLFAKPKSEPKSNIVKQTPECTVSDQRGLVV